MAQDNNPWKRFMGRQSDKAPTGTRAKALRDGLIDDAPDKFDTKQVEAMLSEIEVMVEQLTNLYNMFFAGVERRPPIEKRKRLDHLIVMANNSGKVSLTLKFRCSTVLANCKAHTERWDKQLKQLEVGKLSRRIS